MRESYGQLKKLPIQGYCNAGPTILIGLNNLHLISTLKSIKIAHNMVAAKTTLGWLLYGSENKMTTGSTVSHLVVNHAHLSEDSENSELHKLVADYFTTESFGVKLMNKSLESHEIIRARKILSSTTKKLDGAYETGLLWNEDNIKLPESYGMALKRLRCVENKICRDNQFKEYEAAIMDFIKKGYAVKLTDEEAKTTGPRTWYLPHFGVYNINKPKKMRLVFDAAATVEGVLLNTNLLKGPDENPPLIQILFQFRQGQIAVCGDIKEMFCKCECERRTKTHSVFFGAMDINLQMSKHTRCK